MNRVFFYLNEVCKYRNVGVVKIIVSKVKVDRLTGAWYHVQVGFQQLPFGLHFFNRVFPLHEDGHLFKGVFPDIPYIWLKIWDFTNCQLLFHICFHFKFTILLTLNRVCLNRWIFLKVLKFFLLSFILNDNNSEY